MNDRASRALVIIVDAQARASWVAAAAARGMAAEGVDGPVAAITAARRAGAPAPSLVIVDHALPGMGPALLVRALRSIPGLDGLLAVVAGPAEPPADMIRTVACPGPEGLADALGGVGHADVPVPAVPVPAVPSTGPSGDPVIDQEVVDRVRSYGEEMFQGLVGTYLAELPGRIEQMAAQAAAGDLKGAGGIAHALKGSSGSLGLRRLWQACSEYDKLCRSGAADTATCLDRVRAEADSAITAMRAELARRR